LNKLNGWQRLYLIGSCALMILVIVESNSVRFFRRTLFNQSKSNTRKHCEDPSVADPFGMCEPYYVPEDFGVTASSILFNDAVFFAKYIAALVAIYIGLVILVKIGKWVLRGFQKES
jgi:hypothetical protein